MQGRHEMGHALQLADTSASCWEGVNEEWYPLMNNGLHGTCGVYPGNVTPSDNEKYYAEYWSY